MSSSPQTWLVTGAAGFIGARLVARCNRRGISVVSVDDLQAFDSRPEHAGIEFGTRVDFRKLWDWLDQNPGHPIHAFIHLGACSSTTEMNREFLREVNIEYSQKVWAFCTSRKLPLAYASSAATYGDGLSGFDDEEFIIPALEPLNPYGESKKLFDVWALEQDRAGHHPPAWSGHKFFNVYGFGERHKGGQASVVLHAYDQVKKSGKVRLFRSHKEGIADGHQARDFIYVEDVLDILEFAILKPLERGIFNVGSGQARTFLDLAGAVFKALGVPECIDFIDTPAEIRDRYQYFTEAPMHKLREAGYEAPATPLEEGVTRTVAALEAFSRRRT